MKVRHILIICAAIIPLGALVYMGLWLETLLLIMLLPIVEFVIVMIGRTTDKRDDAEK